MDQNQTENELGKTPHLPPGNSLLYEFLALSQSQQEIFITHLDQVYRLRVTRNGKLILTK